MINLLPTENKKHLRAGRTNLLLVKYIVVVLFAGVFLSIACFAVNLNLDTMKQTNDNNAAIADSASQENASKQIEDARKSLTTAIEIIEQQVSYNKILLAFARTLPENVKISSISIDSRTIGNPTVIKLRAKTQDSVAKLNSSFRDSSIFSNYQLTTSDTTSIDPDYPIDLTASININKANLK